MFKRITIKEVTYTIPKLWAQRGVYPLFKLLHMLHLPIGNALALKGWLFTYVPLLGLRDNVGQPIIFMHCDFFKQEELTMSILRIKDTEGRTLAHHLVGEGYIFTDLSILRLADNKNWTVAHEMALRGYVFKSKAILAMKDSFNIYVGSIQEYRKNLPSTTVSIASIDQDSI